MPAGAEPLFAEHLGKVLRDRRTLQAAFVLTEILAPPLALRGEDQRR